MREQVIRVEGSQPYDVTIGPGVLSRVPSAFSSRVQKVLLVYSAPLAASAARLTAEIQQEGPTVQLVQVPDGEAAKTSETLSSCWGLLGRLGFTRSDAILALGGGAVTDLAGFVAASWLRGIQIVQVPTTLLGMVDAAIGGKTGINTEEGKNLVGAFHVPSSVWCDLDMLRTLPRRDLVAGLAEVVKAGFIRDGEILRIVGDNLDVLGERGEIEASLPVLEELVVRAVKVKADVVGEDLKEDFLREILNYGHTFGHAIERVERYTRRHGEAVSIGMVFAAELAKIHRKLSQEEVDLHRALLQGLGLPVSYPLGLWPGLIEAMRLDKKARGASLRFVILEGIGNPVRLESPAEDLLHQAYSAIGE